MAVLKETTSGQHDRLEAKLDIMRPDLTMAHYRSILEYFYGFYSPMEEILDSVEGIVDVLPDWQERRDKSAELRRDLTSGGLIGSAVDALRICQHVPAVSNAAEAFGVLYVLEGATLGGQIISRHIFQTLGCRSLFFSGYGERTGHMWRSFGDAVELYASKNGDNGPTLNAARCTFDAMEAWLSA